MKKTVLLICSLILCLAGAARAAESEPPAFDTVRDVIDRTEGELEIRTHQGAVVLMLETEGRYSRMVTLPDDRMMELYLAATGDDGSVSAMEAFNDYAWALPLSYTEELAETPKTQSELDALAGKTVQELMDDGFGKEMIFGKDEIAAPYRLFLENGLFKYEFEVDNAASGYSDLMTIKRGKYSGFSRAAFDIDWPGKRSDP